MIITTSWDDGHPLDNKLVELLEKYGIKGTFYIPLANAENKVMERSQIKEISNYHEIGGHTVNHRYLDGLSYEEAKYEITQCKIQLEEITGQPITSFCFPGGKYSERDIELVQQAGFLFGRTTDYFNIKADTKYSLMHTSVQAYNHSALTLSKHCIKRANCISLFQQHFFIPINHSFQKLSLNLLKKAVEENGIFHLWGHSWEIDKFCLWDELEETFNILKNETDALFLNNTECWNFQKNNH